MSELTVWVCMSKKRKTLVFAEKPTKINGEWTGALYVNSSMYDQMQRMVGMSSMTPDSEPEQIVFSVV